MKDYKIEINQRVISAINFLIDNEKVADKSELCNIFSIKPSKFSEILSQRMSAGMDVIQNLCNKFNISAEWLLTGKGEMLKDNATEPSEAVSVVPVPVYNLDVRGGMNGSTEVTIDDAQYVERYTFFDNARKEDKAFPVTGQSMMPKYPSGSLILVREVLNWQEYFGYGDCYVLMLKDGRRILKQIMKSEENTKKNVLCTSINPAYPSEELPRKLIQRVFKVVGCQTLENF
ncbi:MAG: hypothetical protein IJ180_09445 [Bacteroidales bacterium]|nr:hypothetical protein [Bacteroidales bacterium]